MECYKGRQHSLIDLQKEKLQLLWKKGGQLEVEII
jgi:hypothetical protein